MIEKKLSDVLCGEDVQNGKIFFVETPVVNFTPVDYESAYEIFWRSKLVYLCIVQGWVRELLRSGGHCGPSVKGRGVPHVIAEYVYSESGQQHTRQFLWVPEGELDNYHKEINSVHDKFVGQHGSKIYYAIFSYFKCIDKEQFRITSNLECKSEAPIEPKVKFFFDVNELFSEGNMFKIFRESTSLKYEEISNEEIKAMFASVRASVLAMRYNK
jgi:hypothetical protein